MYFTENTPASFKSQNNVISSNFKNVLAQSAGSLVKTPTKSNKNVDKPLFPTVLAYYHRSPPFQNPIFKSSIHHPGLAGIAIISSDMACGGL